MEIKEIEKNLQSKDTLVKRGSARMMSDLLESDPSKLRQSDIETIVSVTREEDDTLTLEYLLKTLGYTAGVNPSYLVNAGLLRVLADILIKNMSGVGINVGREAMRLISTLAPFDPKGAENLGVVRLIVRALTTSTDPYVRWYALMGLRKSEKSLIMRDAEGIIDYSVGALSKDKDESTRVNAAAILLVLASVSPEALKERSVINALIETLSADASNKVKGCVALALHFIAKDAPSQLKDTTIGDALLEAVAKASEALKEKDDKEIRETLVVVASTLSLLALKDPAVLSSGKSIEEVGLADVVSDLLQQSGADAGLKSTLVSTLLYLTESGPAHRLNNRKMVEALVKLLESSKEEYTVSSSAVSILKRTASSYPVLFANSSLLEKLAEVSLGRDRKEENGFERRGLRPTVVLDALLSSEKGFQTVVKGFAEVYQTKPNLIDDLCTANKWQNVLEAVRKEELTQHKPKSVETPVAPPAERKVEAVIPKEEQVTTARTTTVVQKEEAKSYKLNEDQTKTLQDIFKKHDKIKMKDLAKKLKISEDIIRAALERSIQSGKVAFRIQDNVLYIKAKQPAGPAKVEKPAPLMLEKGRKPGVSNCFWCGSAMSESEEACPNCGKSRPRCLICNEAIGDVNNLERCYFCGATFHVEHYKEWADSKKSCPRCSVSWSKT
ncbi:MAG: hypothetical protein WED05_07830 [Candidatus Atabeyarchaeum deiterrae]